MFLRYVGELGDLDRSEMLKHRETLGGLDLRFVCVFRCLDSPIQAILQCLANRCVCSSCCDCADPLGYFTIGLTLEVKWAPKLHPESTKWNQKAQNKIKSIFCIIYIFIYFV